MYFSVSTMAICWLTLKHLTAQFEYIVIWLQEKSVHISQKMRHFAKMKEVMENLSNHTQSNWQMRLWQC